MNMLVKPFTRSITRRAAAGVLIAAALATAGCAAFKPETPEQIVSRRAQERWDALIKRDFPAAYAYTQPGYRAVTSEKDYASRFGSALAWKSVEIFETKCEPDRCTVRLRLTSQMTSPLSIATGGGQGVRGFISETWVKEDGQWWFYQAP